MLPLSALRCSSTLFATDTLACAVSIVHWHANLCKTFSVIHRTDQALQGLYPFPAGMLSYRDNTQIQGDRRVQKKKPSTEVVCQISRVE